MSFINRTTLSYPITNAFPGRIYLDAFRSPTSTDYKQFNVSDIWIYEAHSAWIMIDKTATSGLWVNFAASFTGISTLTGNVGGAIPADGGGNINVIGGSNITFTGVAATHTLTATLSGAVATSYLTDDTLSAIPAAGVLTVHGAGGITTSSSGSTVTITAGPTIPTIFDEDSGSATPALGILNISGGTGIATSGAGNTVTITLAADVATSYVCDTGTATPAANIIDVNGANGISTTGSGHQILISIAGGGISWSTVAVNTAMVVNHGYITNGAGQLVMTLPAVSSIGDEIHIVGLNTGGWIVAQNAGNQILMVSQSTTAGALGTMAASEARATVILRCITTNALWAVESVTGNMILT